MVRDDADIESMTEADLIFELFDEYGEYGSDTDMEVTLMAKLLEYKNKDIETEVGPSLEELKRRVLKYRHADDPKHEVVVLPTVIGGSIAPRWISNAGEAARRMKSEANYLGELKDYVVTLPKIMEGCIELLAAHRKDFPHQGYEPKLLSAMTEPSDPDLRMSSLQISEEGPELHVLEEWDETWEKQDWPAARLARAKRLAHAAGLALAARHAGNKRLELLRKIEDKYLDLSGTLLAWMNSIPSPSSPCTERHDDDVDEDWGAKPEEDDESSTDSSSGEDSERARSPRKRVRHDSSKDAATQSRQLNHDIATTDKTLTPYETEQYECGACFLAGVKCDVASADGCTRCRRAGLRCRHLCSTICADLANAMGRGACPRNDKGEGLVHPMHQCVMCG